MKRSEVKTSLTALESNGMSIDRHEVLSLQSGGVALSVQFVSDGSQRIYYTLDQVLNSLPDVDLAPISGAW